MKYSEAWSVYDINMIDTHFILHNFIFVTFF
jgi:hypothetical protein